MENIPYKLYCEECKKDIDVETMDDGTIVIQCPKCVGECSICDCHLARECFADEPRVEIKHSGNGRGHLD